MLLLQCLDRGRNIRFPHSLETRPVYEAVSLEFELTPEEWIAAQGAHHHQTYVRRGDLQRLQRTAGGLLGVVAVAGLVLGLWVTAVVWSAVGLLYVRAIPGQLKKQTRVQLGKTAREGVIPGLFGRHRIELRDEGMVDITEGYETTIHWSAVEGVEHVDGLFMIYTGTNSFLPIPESAFVGAEELRAFSDAFHTLRGLHAEGAIGAGTPSPSDADVPSPAPS